MGKTLTQQRAEFDRVEQIPTVDQNGSTVCYCASCGLLTKLFGMRFGRMVATVPTYLKDIKVETMWSADKGFHETNKVNLKPYYPSRKGWFCGSCSGEQSFKELDHQIDRRPEQVSYGRGKSGTWGTWRKI